MMSHAKTRVPALLAVGGRTAPVLLEKHSQAAFSFGKVAVGIHRTKDIVVRHPLVERCGEALEEWSTAELLVSRCHDALALP